MDIMSSGGRAFVRIVRDNGLRDVVERVGGLVDLEHIQLRDEALFILELELLQWIIGRGRSISRHD